jgi:hypothetical protein
MKKIGIIVVSIMLVLTVFVTGCFDTNKKPSAVIVADPLTGEVSLSVNFNASQSSDSDGSIKKYEWDFGDGNIGIGIEVTHTYSTIGTFIVKLVVTDNNDASDSTTVNITVNPESVFTQDQAVELLMSTIIDPSSSNYRISAYMLSKPIEQGDVISSEDGQNYTVQNDSWFIFIDDQPNSFFAHPTRYLFINAKDGSYKIFDEDWPPFINNVSIWDTTNHSKGDLIKFYPVTDVNVAITDTDASSAPSADYGDAPDTQDAYYGIKGQFPTLYNTTNSRFGLPGGHTLNVGEEKIGNSVSAEVDANDVNDPDLVPNLVDSDKDDRIFVILNGSKAKLSFVVSISQNAPDVTRYGNILIDFDQNGSWCNGSYGSEWPIINMPINVNPGTSKTITTPEFWWGNQSVLPSPVWIRIALTREMINNTYFSNNWDGSGEYEYGEIEDHIVYLTDDIEPEEEWPPWPKNPPGGKNPDPDAPPGPKNPGPSKGPCGTDVNYHCIIISGGDSSSHMAKGMNPAEQAVDTMTDLATDQGYNIAASLGPGESGSSSNSLSSIESALQGLKGQVKCGDHVLIYIVGHGNKASDGAGINLKGSDGKTDEMLTPNKLSNLLGSNLPPCPDEDCDTPGKCCHVTLVIESCYAGNFNVSGITGQGRTVMGSSDDEPAAANNGGAFTQGFASASRDSDYDSDGENGVDPSEAYDGADDSVGENNKRSGKSQEPWKESNECECKCPCSPNITADKEVSLDGLEWYDELEAPIWSLLQFEIEIENTGKCRNVTNLSIVDTIPSCMTYLEGSSELSINGESGSWEPDNIESDGTGSDILTWNLGELGLFAPGETIIISYSATAEEIGENENIVESSAQCTYDPSITVSAEDSVSVYVFDPET